MMPPNHPLTRLLSDVLEQKLKPSLAQRLAAPSWLDDWPSHEGWVGFPGPATEQVPVLPGDLGQDLAEFQRTAQALADPGNAPATTRGKVEALLAAIEGWNATSYAQSEAVWPPTQADWNRRFVKTFCPYDPPTWNQKSQYDRKAQAMAVLAVYPQAVRSAVLDYPADDLPNALKPLLALWSPAPEVMAAPEAKTAPTEGPVASDGPGAKPQEAPARVRQPLVTPEWMREWVAHALGHTHLALAREGMDERIKNQMQAGSKKGKAQHQGYWLLDELVPALASLSARDVEAVLACWPSHQTIKIGTPARWFSNVKLWGVLAQAEPETRSVLLKTGLSHLIDASDWTFEQRYELLPVMFPWARNNRQAFVERRALWEGLGGQLDQVNPSPQDGGLDPVATFAQAPAAPMTARAWFEAQNHPMWNDELRPRPSRSSPRP